MQTEREQMVAGMPYDPGDPELVASRDKARRLCRRYSDIPYADRKARAALMEELIGRQTDISIQAPFYCDYGFNILCGRDVYFNFNCVVLDVCPVEIGDNTLFGPAVQIYTATHPEDPIERREKESGKPIYIGKDVWVGGGAIICPGVRIGDCSIIGAGSVVNRDIPDGVVAAGNPCRVIRPIRRTDRSGS